MWVFVNEQYAMFHLHSSILTTLIRPEITAAVVFKLDFIENKFSPLIIPLPSRHFVWKCYGLRLSSNGLVMEDEMTLDGAITSASFDEALETVSVRYG